MHAYAYAYAFAYAYAYACSCMDAACSFMHHNVGYLLYVTSLRTEQAILRHPLKDSSRNSAKKQVLVSTNALLCTHAMHRYVSMCKCFAMRACMHALLECIAMRIYAYVPTHPHVCYVCEWPLYVLPCTKMDAFSAFNG
jgi:hypothetical protein